jgi:hypothetical protein
MLSFKASIYYEGSGQLEFYASPDGSTWTPLSPVLGAPVSAPGGSRWFSRNVEVSSLLLGTNYLEVAMPATNTYSWAPQIEGFGSSRLLSKTK